MVELQKYRNSGEARVAWSDARRRGGRGHQERIEIREISPLSPAMQLSNGVCTGRDGDAASGERMYERDRGT